MGGIAAEHQIEVAIGERRPLRSALLSAQIVQAAPGRFRRHHFQHGRRQIISHYLPCRLRHLKADMARAAAQVQHPRRAMLRRRLAQLGELRALRMHLAAQIGGGLAAELLLHVLLMRVATLL